MELVTKESMESLVSGTESLVKVVGGVASELTNEAINLFIIQGVLSVLQYAVVFVVFLIVKKYCDSMMTNAEESHIKLFKALKTTALVLSLVFFSSKSFPHLTEIAKALVAPKIFLLEKANEFRQGK